MPYNTRVLQSRGKEKQGKKALVWFWLWGIFSVRHPMHGKRRLRNILLDQMKNLQLRKVARLEYPAIPSFHIFQQVYMAVAISSGSKVHVRSFHQASEEVALWALRVRAGQLVQLAINIQMDREKEHLRIRWKGVSSS